jgi:hypothetical protein
VKAYREAREALMLEDRKPTRDDTSEVQEPTAENTSPGKVSKLAVWSYVLYNFGNTPFAATGRPLKTAPYLRYLKNKFGELYGLSSEQM